MSRLIDADELTGYIKACNVGCGCSEDHQKRILEAIDDCPTIRPEPCEDAVSRKAVSEWLKQYGQDVLHGKYKFSLMYIWKNLMDLPSVTPKIQAREDAVSRAGVLRMIDCIDDHHAITPYQSIGAVTEHMRRIAQNMDSATPKVPECEDAISRQAVLDVVNNPLNVQLDAIIEKLPSVTPKMFIGTQDWFGEYIHGLKVYRCNACGHKHIGRTSFCPDCGIKMQEENGAG